MSFAAKRLFQHFHYHGKSGFSAHSCEQDPKEPTKAAKVPLPASWPITESRTSCMTATLLYVQCCCSWQRRTAVHCAECETTSGSSDDCENLEFTYDMMQGLFPICKEHIEEFLEEESLVGNRIIQNFDIPEAQVRLRSKIWWEIQIAKQTAAQRKRGRQIADAWNVYLASLGESPPNINLAVVEDGNYYLFHFDTVAGPQSWAVLYQWERK